MKLKIGIYLICTGKYDIFLEPLIDSLDKYFFKDDEIIIYLFWDKNYEIKLPGRFLIIYTPTEHKPFPAPTLFRYKNLLSISDKIKCDYLFYSDVDMLFVGDVGREILPQANNDCGLVATLHPGFYNGGGSWDTNEKSTAFMPLENRIKYYCGGFQGGKTIDYMNACSIMARNINFDEMNSVMAIWHDESHWNQYLSIRNPKVLTPEYCMVEQINLRQIWGISHFSPKIIAIAKNHNEIRS